MSLKLHGSVSSQPPDASPTVHILGTFTLPSTQEVKLAMHIVVGVPSFSGSNVTLTYSKDTDLGGSQYFYGKIGAQMMNLTSAETGINVSGTIVGGPVEETDVSGFVLGLVTIIKSDE